MSKCEIFAFMTSVGPPYYCGGQGHAVHQCVTHQMAVAATDVACPIGRIEAATDAMIEKIQAALASKP